MRMMDNFLGEDIHGEIGGDDMLAKPAINFRE
jgi:hypothetical protein